MYVFSFKYYVPQCGEQGFCRRRWCFSSFLSGPQNWVLWDATSRAATSVYHWFKMLEYCFFTILNKFLGAEPFKTLLLLKYDVFQAPFKRLRIVIKILFPTISLDCNYLQILSMILVTNCSVWAQLDSCHGLTAKWCTATWTLSHLQMVWS